MEAQSSARGGAGSGGAGAVTLPTATVSSISSAGACGLHEARAGRQYPQEHWQLLGSGIELVVLEKHCSEALQRSTPESVAKRLAAHRVAQAIRVVARVSANRASQLLYAECFLPGGPI